MFRTLSKIRELFSQTLAATKIKTNSFDIITAIVAAYENRIESKRNFVPKFITKNNTNFGNVLAKTFPLLPVGFRFQCLYKLSGHWILFDFLKKSRDTLSCFGFDSLGCSRDHLLDVTSKVRLSGKTVLIKSFSLKLQKSKSSCFVFVFDAACRIDYIDLHNMLNNMNDMQSMNPQLLHRLLKNSHYVEDYMNNSDVMINSRENRTLANHFRKHSHFWTNCLQGHWNWINNSDVIKFSHWKIKVSKFLNDSIMNEEKWQKSLKEKTDWVSFIGKHANISKFIDSNPQSFLCSNVKLPFHKTPVNIENLENSKARKKLF